MPSIFSLRFLALCLPLSTLIPSVFAWECYYPDGETLSTDIPCNTSASVSSCCSSDAWCLDNGLCFGAGVTSRGSCTDKDWGDGCAQYCQSDNPSGGMPLQPCDPGTMVFSCGANTTNCVDSVNTFVLAGGVDLILRGSMVAELQDGQSVALELSPSATLSAEQSTNTSGAASTITVTAAANTTSSTTTNDANQYTAADVAGAAVGAGVPLLLGLAGAFFIIIHQRKKLREAEVGTQSHESVHSPPGIPYAGGYTDAKPYYAPLPQQQASSPPQQGHFREMMVPVAEIDTQRERQELDGAAK
ncbi:hypothetical protein LTR85_011076 [Meristemomyces frigidus]|nr:hypothetical protein LTR85_011076 [Meristemomyces frigidus]